ncbi:MAG TPA: S8 family serine peptidase [Myxococcota bacterium]|nr:S8 family serine peptidase [Myxococcota bacterium]HRY94808.1 S8 family serine peptidase [Myxococcota bacterium]
MHSAPALLAVSLAALLAPGLAPAAEPNPYFRLLERSTRLQAGFRALPLGLELLPHPFASGTPLFPALLDSADPAATAAAVEQLGGRAARPIGSVLPVRASLEALSALACRPEVRRLEARPPLRPRLDLSRPDVRADQVEAGVGLPLPVDGSGVLVALVDTGVDFRHPDLLSPSGRTRVQLLWDQAFGSGAPPPGQTVGSLCDRDSLVRGTCTSIDLVGHGTHVTATMASSGEAFRGMAPGADIMAVASLDFALLVESVDWLFQQAAERGQPMVVNLSLGGHYGPHDGTALEDSALSALTGPGRIIVAAAGNEGNDRIHLGYDPQGGTGKTLLAIYGGMDVSAALLDTWVAPGAQLEFAVGVQRDGQEVAETPFTAAAGPGGAYPLEDADGTPLGRVDFQPAAGPDAQNGKQQLDLVIEPTENAYAGNARGYAWYVKARGSGAFDCWSAAAGFFTSPALFSDRSDGGLVPGDTRLTVGAPAVARDVLAIGSYATRAAWTDAHGAAQDHPETTEGDLSFFSSRGPSADPERTGQKPLLAAPGEFIAAAMSQSTGEMTDGTQLDEGHLVMRGTSMACPHAAGVVALMLQADPLLEPARVAEILAATARRDGHTGQDLPDDAWGFGKIDALEAVAMSLGTGLCRSPADCAEGHRCGDEGRCLAEESGCATGGAAGPGLPFGALLIAVLLLGRRPSASRRGWSRSAPGPGTRGT